MTIKKNLKLPSKNTFDMNNERYWITIDFLLSCIENGEVDAEKLKEAHLRLSTELDRRSVFNLPIDETKRLISVLNGLYDKVSDYE